VEGGSAEGAGGLGLRDFSRACGALEQDGVEPFASVAKRPLLCGALHVAMDVCGGGRLTAEMARTIWCSPRHQTHCEPSLLELNGKLLTWPG